MFYFYPVSATQDTAMCDIVAATNIQSIYSIWSCTVAHIPSSNVCNWNTVTCSGGTVTQIYTPTVRLAGNLLCLFINMV